MAVQIQFRRDTTSNWTASNPVLAAGELGLDLTTYTYKIGNGASTWNQLPYQSMPNSAVSTAAYSAKGSVAAASAAGAPINVAVGANNSVFVADSTQTAGVKWATTLSGLSLTSPVVNTPTITSPAITGTTTIGSGATLTSPTLNTPTITTPAVTGGTISTAVLTSPKETWTVSATAATGTVAVPVATSTNVYYTTNASANWTFNFTGLSAGLAVGQSTTVGFLVTNGATAYYPTAFQIDGTAVTPKWQGGTAPTSGNASSIDAYMFTIIKTAATPTYTVLASQTKFA